MLNMRRMLSFSVSVLLLALLGGCSFLGDLGQGDYLDIDSESMQRRGTSSIPAQTKPNGQPFTIAYVDIDPYPVSGAVLYYIITGLRDEGWLSFEHLPFDPADTDAGAMIDWLAQQDTGPYIRFDSDANYYTEYQSEDEIRESLTRHVNNGTIDLIMTNGTWPALMVKSFGLDMPIMMFGCANPLGSGLVESVENSGNPNVWATFDPTAYERQLLYYYNCVPFTNIGIVYYDESIANMDSYERAADTLSIKVTPSHIERIDTSSAENIEQYYTDLVAEFRRLVEKDGIDAFMLTVDIIVDLDRAEELLEPFTSNNIPVFVQAGEQFVESGALMNVSALEMEGLGVFSARSITQLLAGTPLSQLPQEYRNSPFLVLNLDVAEKIGYRPTFETLLACEHVYTADN